MDTTVTLSAEALKTLIKESVREAMREEWFGLWLPLIHEINDAEQTDIEKEVELPSDYKSEDFVDMTAWLIDKG